MNRQRDARELDPPSRLLCVLFIPTYVVLALVGTLVSAGGTPVLVSGVMSLVLTPLSCSSVIDGYP